MAIYENFTLGYGRCRVNEYEDRQICPVVAYRNKEEMDERTLVKLHQVLEAILKVDLRPMDEVEFFSPMAQARVFKTILSNKCSKEVSEFFELPETMIGEWKGNKNYILEIEGEYVVRAWTTNGVISFPYTVNCNGEDITHEFKIRSSTTAFRKFDITHLENNHYREFRERRNHPEGLQFIVSRLMRYHIPSSAEYERLNSLLHAHVPFEDTYANEAEKVGVEFHLKYPIAIREDYATNLPRIRAFNALGPTPLPKAEAISSMKGFHGLAYLGDARVLNQYTEEVYLPVETKEGWGYEVKSFLGIAGNDIFIPYDLLKSLVI